MSTVFSHHTVNGSQCYYACRGQSLRNICEVLLHLVQCELSLFSLSSVSTITVLSSIKIFKLLRML